MENESEDTKVVKDLGLQDESKKTGPAPKAPKAPKAPAVPKKAAGKSQVKPKESQAKAATTKAPKMVVLTSGNDSILEANINGKVYSGKSIEVDPRDVKNVVAVLKEAGAVLK